MKKSNTTFTTKAVEVTQDAYTEVSSDGKYFRSVIALGMFTDEGLANRMTNAMHQIMREGLTKSSVMKNGIEAIEVTKKSGYDA